MMSKNRIAYKLWCLVLILFLTKVCQGKLVCYVCENCDQITAETPQAECNEDFFTTSGETGSSVQTTTELPKTTAESTEDSTTTTTKKTTLSPVTVASQETSTEAQTTETATEVTTEKVAETSTDTTTTVETTESTATTEAQPPTPPTVGPPMTTTNIPTPANPGTVKPINNLETLNNNNLTQEQHVDKDEVESIKVENTTTKAYKPSAEFRVRHLRSVSDVTYHCYKIHTATVNGSIVVNRGCSRVETMQSVCGQLKTQIPNGQIKKCYPCSRSKCNGSSALNVSITALVVAVVAVFMHWR